MMRTWMKRVALWMVVCLPVLAVAQQGTVRGFLYEQETGEPAIFTPVSLKGANDLRLGAETDVNGYFSISKVPPGHYTLGHQLGLRHAEQADGREEGPADNREGL